MTDPFTTLERQALREAVRRFVDVAVRPYQQRRELAARLSGYTA